MIDANVEHTFNDKAEVDINKSQNLSFQFVKQ